jgi:ParB family chromosome partitioning protein
MGDRRGIPLNKLKKSPRDARKTPHGEETVETYAASIAAKGILQNLVVEPELDADGSPTGFYFVTIGEGRRLAQMLRAKRKIAPSRICRFASRHFSRARASEMPSRPYLPR